jgi:type IV pilus assembly protein PilZ
MPNSDPPRAEPEDPSSEADRRGEDRAAITLRVDYKRMNTFFADYAKNISKGGTFIRTSKPLDVGTEFVFVLSLPSQDRQLELRGKVMWVVRAEDAADPSHAGMGIKFLFDDDDARLTVEGIVEDLMREALGEHIASRLLEKK